VIAGYTHPVFLSSGLKKWLFLIQLCILSYPIRIVVG
jgi:hypothetical protein